MFRPPCLSLFLFRRLLRSRRLRPRRRHPRVLHNQHPERIRLSRIDSPEKGQAYGNNAKHAARSPWLSYMEPGSNMCPMGVVVVGLPQQCASSRARLVAPSYISRTPRSDSVDTGSYGLGRGARPKAHPLRLPSCSLKRRACLHALPSAPFNARCDGYGCGCRCHGSPPLLDRTSAECAGLATSLPAPGDVTGAVPVMLHEHSRQYAKRMPSTVSALLGVGGVLGILYVPISYRDSLARPRDNDRLHEEGKVGGSARLRLQPDTTYPARQYW